MLTSVFTKRICSSLQLIVQSRRFYDKPATYERSLNQVQLIGRVGGDPQKRGTEAHPVVIFSVATHSNYKNEDGVKQTTEWHRISVFKPSLRTLVFNYLRKGQRVHITGKLSYGEVKDGDKTTYITSIIADDVIFFGSSGSSSSINE